MKARFLLGSMLAGLASAAVLQAGNPAPACMAATLSVYEEEVDDAPYECSVGLLNYTDFDLASASATNGATALSASQIEVTPVADIGDPGGGFTLTATNGGAFAVGMGQTASYTIGWYFAIDPGPEASGASLSMDPPLGDVMITQDYCNDSSFTNNNTQCEVTGDFNSFPFSPQVLTVTTIPPMLTDSIVFDPPAQMFANVITTIDLNGDSTSMGCPTGMNGSCFTGVTSTVVVTPEPTAATLGLACLLGMGLMRKRRVLP